MLAEARVNKKKKKKKKKKTRELLVSSPFLREKDRERESVEERKRIRQKDYYYSM